jgi:hypothetical protein
MMEFVEKYRAKYNGAYPSGWAVLGYDAIYALIGRKKTLHPRKNDFTVASGTKKMYEFMRDNPSMESYPASYVLNPAVIAKNDLLQEAENMYLL